MKQDHKYTELGPFIGLKNALIIEIIIVAAIVGCCMVINNL